MPRSTSVSVYTRGTSAGAAGRNVRRARPSGPRPWTERGIASTPRARWCTAAGAAPAAGRPLTPFDRLRDPARDQAQHRQLGGTAAPTDGVLGRVVGLPRCQQPVLGQSRPAGEEIQCAQQPAAPRARPGVHPGGKDGRLGHLTVGDQDLQRVQQTAIGRRRVAAGGRRLRQPGRRLRRPARIQGLPAGRLQLAGQPVIQAGRRGHPMPSARSRPTRPAARWCSRCRRAGLRSP